MLLSIKPIKDLPLRKEPPIPKMYFCFLRPSCHPGEVSYKVLFVARWKSVWEWGSCRQSLISPFEIQSNLERICSHFEHSFGVKSVCKITVTKFISQSIIYTVRDLPIYMVIYGDIWWPTTDLQWRTIRIAQLLLPVVRQKGRTPIVVEHRRPPLKLPDLSDRCRRTRLGEIHR